MPLERVHNNITPTYSLEPSSKPMHAKQGSEEEPPLIPAFFLAETCKLEGNTSSLSQDTCSIIPGILSNGLCKDSLCFHYVSNVRPKVSWCQITCDISVIIIVLYFLPSPSFSISSRKPLLSSIS